MRKGIALAIAIAFFFALAIPASADTVFNEASKCIASWGKPCDTSAKSAPAKSMSSSMASVHGVKDVLNNTVPTGTVKEGNLMSRRATSCPMMKSEK